ncbi:MAG: DUF11 domain-containing protein [Gemmatales bacterium]|nr:DUF11 domain-containing protein [Gemmatales bacterium]MDW8386646.1 hypothetical protein [Gemmatales bacterium]
MRGVLARLLPAALVLAFMPACAQSPVYFPYNFYPNSLQFQTHPKPPGFGYYANFDPYAIRLEVRPLEMSNPVGTQQVLIATVYDAQGKPRRGRRIEWMVEGVGHIVEVDESGWSKSRGGKVDNRYAISYTDYHEHTFDRGNNDPSDDFTVRPGQSWCVISSPVEGDTHVTVYAPGIYNWDRHKVDVTLHWINAGWTLPPAGAARLGAQHTLTTNVFRYTDRMPLANYRVRYTVLDGPPAGFLPTQQRTAEAITDLQGNASVALVQLAPAAGVNRIGIEIIRPPDPCCPTGPGIIIGRGETLVEWVAPNLAISKTGPMSVGLGQPFTFNMTVTNTGRVETEAVTIRDVIPEGLAFLNAQPPANQEGQTLVWTVGPLGPGRSAVVQATFRSDQPGRVVNTVTAISSEGLRADASAAVNVTMPGLDVRMTGPETAVVGVPVAFQITVTNTGNGPASNVVLVDQFDEGLEHVSGANPLQLEVGTLAAGESRTYPINLTPRRTGVLVNRVTATADGGLQASAQAAVTVTQARISVTKTGPAFKYARSQVEFNITVTNPGEVPLNNVVVRDQLPPELSFVQASSGGRLMSGNEVIWNFGTLQAGQTQRLQVTTRAEQVTARTVNAVVVTADPGISERAEAVLEIRGAPALRLEAMDTRDPVEIGQTTTYEISVTNTGTLAANGVTITATAPALVRIVSGVGPGNLQARIEGNRISFPAVDGVQPGQSLLYSVVVEALSPGDARFRIEMRSTSLGPEPVIEEESTNIFRPLEGDGRVPRPEPMPQPIPPPQPPAFPDRPVGPPPPP